MKGMRSFELEKENSYYTWFSKTEVEEEQKDLIYLDNAATTFPKPDCVYQVMDQVNRSLAVNAGRGSYRLAQIAVEGMDSLRMELLDMIGAKKQAEVVFTTSATMAFNQIIGGRMLSDGDRVYVSPFVHNAVMRTLWMHQQKCGYVIRKLPVNVDNMEIDLEKLEYMFREQPPTYVFLSHVSNVTGYILPVKEIFELAKKVSHGQAVVVLDAAQSFGLVPINYEEMPFDAITFAGHKTLYGPLGIAGFIKKKTLELEPYLAGGTGSASLKLDMPQEGAGRYEPGSPNITAIAGLYASVRYIKEQGLEKIFAHEQNLTRLLVEGLKKIDGVKVYTLKDVTKQVGIVSFNIEGYQAEEVAMLLAEDYHIAVRAGYHCAPLVHEHLKDKGYAGTVRVSMGWFNDEEDVEKLLKAVCEIS